MSKRRNFEVGKIYNILKLCELKTVYETDGHCRRVAVVECTKCGRVKTIRPRCLFDTRFNSCICQLSSHQMTKTRIYGVYHNMKYRCYNPNAYEYRNYGGKGIRVCKEWLGDNGFLNFLDWANTHGYKAGLTIDRVDSNADYSPDNCQWVTLNENVTRANKTCQHRRANKGRYYGVSPSGEFYDFENASAFGREHNLNPSCIRAVANGAKRSHAGWHFGFISDYNIEPLSTIETQHET